MVFQQTALIIDRELNTFDFEAWAGQQPGDGEEAIGLTNGAIRVPRMVLLSHYNRLPKRQVKFNRHSVFARDHYRCQYCGVRFQRNELNIDHVEPRSKGGPTSWENVVCCCIRCNRRKRDRRPEEAGMKLMRAPFRPSWTPALLMPEKPTLYREWEPFLVNVASSNTEFVD